MQGESGYCSTEVDDNFLRYIREYEEEKDPAKRLRLIIRAEGYLRYLYFELLGQSIRDWSGGDLKTLICGLSCLIVRSVKLCYELHNEYREMACGISRNLIDLVFSLMRRWRSSERVRELGSELWVMLDLDNLADRREAEFLSEKVAAAIADLLS
ncbi:MAG: hypothetical protein DRN78_04845 [Thermoproteota archaeon]|nr:MAG: hypothetical protein DRN78_04845 [Candidatus Korarchaeota archaeon]